MVKIKEKCVTIEKHRRKKVVKISFSQKVLKNTTKTVSREEVAKTSSGSQGEPKRTSQKVRSA